MTSTASEDLEGPRLRHQTCAMCLLRGCQNAEASEEAVSAPAGAHRSWPRQPCTPGVRKLGSLEPLPRLRNKLPTRERRWEF
eukprot:9502931-Pyramimonas_sp.AAC.1